MITLFWINVWKLQNMEWPHHCIWTFLNQFYNHISIYLINVWNLQLHQFKIKFEIRDINNYRHMQRQNCLVFWLFQNCFCQQMFRLKKQHHHWYIYICQFKLLCSTCIQTTARSIEGLKTKINAFLHSILFNILRNIIFQIYRPHSTLLVVLAIPQLYRLSWDTMQHLMIVIDMELHLW